MYQNRTDSIVNFFVKTCRTPCIADLTSACWSSSGNILSVFKKCKSVGGVVFLILALHACGSDKTAEETESEAQSGTQIESQTETQLDKPLTAYEEMGTEIVSDAFKALSGVLGEKMASGGVEEALEYCSEHAVPLTDSVADAHNVTLRRISDRFRNPQNKPSVAETAVLDSFRSALQADEPAGAIIQDLEHEFVFYSPIIISNSLCLNCHGEVEKDISTEDFITISLIYPDDRATGYSLGDLRGMWQVKFEKPGI